MWVYHADSLRSRLLLPEMVAYWVDYWLFLHSAETHPLWNVRPLGLRLIAETALGSGGVANFVLREQLSDEAIAAARLAPFLSDVSAPPTSNPLAGSRWRPEWIRWFESLLRHGTREVLVFQLGSEIAAALQRKELGVANFLTRRLAAELADHEWSHRALFRLVKSNFCDSWSIASREESTSDAFASTMALAFADQPRTKHIVEIDVAPVRISRRVARDFKSRKLVVESSEDSETTLRRFVFEVDAAHSDEAAAVALESARELLERLRLTHYVRTHLVGDFKINSIDQGLQCSSQLPQPFWDNRGGFRRDVPRVPRRYQQLLRILPAEEKPRWRAAHWHISEALSTWSEDTHTAASHVWQALESFSVLKGRGLEKVLPFVDEYIGAIVQEMGEHIANAVYRQRSALLDIGVTCDWYGWDKNRSSFHRWLSRVFDEHSNSYHKMWRTPPPPELLFDPIVGLLPVIRRKLNRPTDERWMEARAVSDLKLLYGVRNGVVHHGARMLGRRMAMYLGQAGLELLFTIMKVRAQPILASAERQKKIG
jgi:hypothetical protein